MAPNPGTWPQVTVGKAFHFYVSIQGQTVQDNVSQDIAGVRELGVERTLSFYVNGKPLQDFGYEQLRSLVEREIQAAY